MCRGNLLVTHHRRLTWQDGNITNVASLRLSDCSNALQGLHKRADTYVAASPCELTFLLALCSTYRRTEVPEPQDVRPSLLPPTARAARHPAARLIGQRCP